VNKEENEEKLLNLLAEM